jgi:thiamine-phosphate diphosphorylase
VGRLLPGRPFLYAILDAGRLAGRPAAAAAEALARGGAALVQLRAKDVSDRRLLELARSACAGAHRGGALFVVNDRADVARMAGADGVHVGQDDLPPSEARRVVGSDAIVGVSTHSLEQLDEAIAAPVDYVAVGPVYPTASKANPDPVVGPALVRRARERTERPLVAIGGIDLERAPEVVAAGADGLAVIAALMDAPDLEAAARAFVARMRG